MNTPFPARSEAFTEAPLAHNWIGGQWLEAESGETLPVLNPRYGKAFSRVPLSDKADVERAVEAARRAWPDWKETPLRERAAIFFSLRELMRRHVRELSLLISHENGKTFQEARASVLKAIECVEFGCSLPNLASGEQLEVSRGVTCQLVHEPLGVVAGVTPFNFPLMVPLWMLPQGIIAGNTFILKPSEQVPLSMQRLASLFREAGLPDGVFNLVNGAKEVVEALADHPQIAAMAFVGSTRVAREVYARGSRSGKRMLCLGGAKNHLIVVPDADVELTEQNVVDSFTGCAGQRCMAASVMLAVGEVDHIIQRIAARAQGLQPGRDVGAIINQASVERIRGYVDRAEQAGARILVDGRDRKGESGGFWFGPTVIDRADPESPAAREEIFGPVLTIVRVDTLEEAIAMENESPYGNAAAIYTTSGEVARKTVGRLSAGMCGVNIGVPVPREPFGFGGWNDSKFGHGNMTGWDGFRFWTRPRKITAKWALQKDQTWMS